MTIIGYLACIVVSLFLCIFLLILGQDFFRAWAKAVLCLVVVAVVFCSGFFIFNHTASGQRALVDQKSELNGGLNRTITIYTATGDVIAQYTGKIDIEGNDGGYVIFDFEGKRYTYYNCFVESIAEIG